MVYEYTWALTGLCRGPGAEWRWRWGTGDTEITLGVNSRAKLLSAASGPPHAIPRAQGGRRGRAELAAAPPSWVGGDRPPPGEGRREQEASGELHWQKH